MDMGQLSIGWAVAPGMRRSNPRADKKSLGAHSPAAMLLWLIIFLIAFPSEIFAAWDNFPTKSINLATAEATDGAVEFYELLGEQCLSGLEDPHPVHGFQSSDGSFIFSGKGFDGAGKLEGFIVKISNNGGCTWGWTSGLSRKDDAINAAAELPGEVLLAVGFREVDGVYRRSITKIDLASGGEVWTATDFGDTSGSNGAFENVQYSATGETVLVTGLARKPDTEEFAFKSYGNTPAGRATVMKFPPSAFSGSTAPTSSDATWTVTDLPVPNFEDDGVFLSTAKAAVALPNGEVLALFFTDGGEAALTTMALISSTGQILWGPKELGEYGEGTDIALAADGQHVYMSSLGYPDISARLTKIAAADGNILWSKAYRSVPIENSNGYLNECWGVAATQDGGAIMACGTGVEDCERFSGQDREQCESGQPIASADNRPDAVPRAAGVWQSYIVRANEDGELLWQRVDQRRWAGDPSLGSSGWEATSSASEYVAPTRDGGFVFVQDESAGVGILKLKGQGETAAPPSTESTNKPTASPTPSPTPKETSSPTPSPTSKATTSPTPSPTSKTTPAPTISIQPPASLPKSTPAPTASASPSPSPKSTPAPTSSSSPSPSPKSTPSPIPPATPAPSASPTPVTTVPEAPKSTSAPDDTSPTMGEEGDPSDDEDQQDGLDTDLRVTEDTDEVYTIPVNIVLEDFGIVEEFTEALQNQLKSDLASTAGVPVDQVIIVSITSGSVSVEAAIVIPADVSLLKAQSIQSKLSKSNDDGSQLLSEEVFGVVTVETNEEPTKVDINDIEEYDDSNEQEDESSSPDSNRYGTSLALSIMAIFLRLALY